MRLQRILLITGIWIAVLPYLGFPYSWKNILFTISGLVLMYYSFRMYQNAKKEKEEPLSDNFSENFGFTEGDVYEEPRA